MCKKKTFPVSFFITSHLLNHQFNLKLPFIDRMVVRNFCLIYNVKKINIFIAVMFNIYKQFLNNNVMKTKEKKLELLTPIQMMKLTVIAVIMVAFVNTARSQNTVVDIVVGSEAHTTLEAAVIAAELADLK